jgi:outer membrane protein insertion porin family
LWGVRRPETLDIDPLSPLAQSECKAANGTTRLSFNGCVTGETLVRAPISPFQERFVGDSPSPRLSVGVGLNWNSPFGPFRIDIAHALLSEEGDDTKLFSFNVGTAF